MCGWILDRELENGLRGEGDRDVGWTRWGGSVDVDYDNLGLGIGVVCCGQILVGASLYSKYSKYASWCSSVCESQLGAIIANCGLGVGVGLYIDIGV